MIIKRKEEKEIKQDFCALSQPRTYLGRIKSGQVLLYLIYRKTSVPYMNNNFKNVPVYKIHILSVRNNIRLN